MSELPRAGESKVVVGPHASLTELRLSESLRHLYLEGEVRSLEGIERLQRLEVVRLDGLPSPCLARLAALPKLETLMLEVLSGTVSYDELERLTGLDRLELVVEHRSDAKTLAAVDYGRLPALTVLKLKYLSDQVPVPISLRWLGSLPRLEVLNLEMFVFSREEEKHLRTLGKHLRRLLFTPTSEEQIDRVRGCFAPHVTVIATEEQDRDEGKVVEVPDASAGLLYELRVDLAGRWGLETNPEALWLLQEHLERRAPELLQRLDLDVESTWVFASGERREDVEALNSIIADFAAEGG